MLTTSMLPPSKFELMYMPREFFATDGRTLLDLWSAHLHKVHGLAAAQALGRAGARPQQHEVPDQVNIHNKHDATRHL